MQKLYFVLFLFLFPALLSAQSLLTEDFGSGTFPPAGWTIDAQAGNWSANNSNNAGGHMPELRFNWSPQFSGETHIISPSIDLTGVTALKVKFKYMLDHYGGPYTIGVATRSGGGSWNIVWQIVNPTESVPATEEVASISNSDLGASDFQICWFFSGDSYNLNYWYIDDIDLFIPLAHDAMLKSIEMDNQYEPNTTITPKAVVKNFGTNTETFDATCKIDLGGNNVYDQTSASMTLAPDEEQTVTFPGFFTSSANDLYQISFKTNLQGDMDTTNDSKSKWFNTYTTERNMVVLEIGTGAWCQYCPGAAMGADDLVDSGKAVAVIEYHDNDPFANPASDARNIYYNITGFPTANFDGIVPFVGGSHTVSNYPYYLPIYNSRKPINSAYQINVYGTHTGNDYNLTIYATKVATTPEYNNLVLQAVVTESDIPYTWQGQTQLSFVERVMMPDQNGTALDFSSANTQILNLSFTADASWVTDNCEITAFIQNNDGKEIYQGTKVKLTELAPVPVELTSFTSSVGKEGITLNWATATETNNHGFEIERSADGKTFYRIGFVEGKGTSTEKHSYSYMDKIKYSGSQHVYYRLKQMDFDGRANYSKILDVKFDVPGVFSLSQNYPNPFNPTTKINYAVPEQSLVTIKLFNVLGQEVMTLVNSVKEAGSYEVNLNASNLSSGIYIYKMSAKNYSCVRKMSILK